MEVYDIAIIGSGPAGMSAAVYALRANMSVLLLDKLAPGGQMIHTDSIQNYIGLQSIHGVDLAMKMFAHAKALGVVFDYKTVVGIQESNGVKYIHCKEEAIVYTAKTVILCTGTKPRMLGIENELKFAGRGISWCAICDGASYRDKHVVVIGGGNSAVEESLYLADLAKSISVITKFDLTADPIACNKLLSKKNVKIYPYQDIIAFQGKEKLCGVQFQSTKTKAIQTVTCDGVFEYIGLTPVTECFHNLDIVNSLGYIEVDETMSTKISGIYGAGDCIVKSIRQILTACNDGVIAAQFASHYVKNL